MCVNGVPFGQKDPQFKLDVSFYTFDLPWYRFLLGFGFAAAVLSLIAAALAHYLYGGLRVTSPGRARHGGGHRPSVGAARHLRVAEGGGVLARPVRTRGEVQRLQGHGQLDGPAVRGRQRLSPGEDDPVLHRGHLRAAVLRDALAPHLAAAGDRLRSDGALGDPDRRALPGDRAEVPGPAERAGQGSAVHPEEHRRHARGVRHRRRRASTDYSRQGQHRRHDRSSATTPNSAARYRLVDPNVVSPTFQQLQQSGSTTSFPSTLDVDRYKGSTASSRTRSSACAS